MSITTGQAIALGSLATPDRSKPFTNAVIRKQNIDLAREQRKAAAEQKAAEQKKQLASLFKYGDTSDIHPFYAEQAKEVAVNGMNDQVNAYNTNDSVGLTVASQKTKNEIDRIREQSDILKNALKLKSQGYNVPDEITDAFSNQYSKGHPKLQKILEEHPEYKTVVSYDPESKSYNLHPPKRIDVAEDAQKTMNHSVKQMVFDQTGKVLDDNSVEQFYSLHPEELNKIALNRVKGNDVLVANIGLNNPKELKDQLDIVRQKNPDYDPHQQLLQASANVYASYASPYNVNVVRETKASVPFDVRNAFKNEVAYSPKVVPANTNVVTNALFGPDQDAIVVNESTPGEGENKPSRYSAQSGYIFDGDTKVPVKLSGHDIDGAVIRTYSAPNDKGGKDVYAEIKGQSLTNKQLYPNKEWTDNNGKELKEANQRPVINYIVPFRAIAKDQQAEYRRYNKVNSIKKIEQAHGIKYSDFIPETKHTTGKTPKHSMK